MQKRRKSAARLLAAAFCLAWTAVHVPQAHAELIPYAPLNPAGGILIGFPYGMGYMSDQNLGQLNRTQNTNWDMIIKAVQGVAGNVVSVQAAEEVSAARVSRMFSAGVDDAISTMKDVGKADALMQLRMDFDPESPLDPCVEAAEGVRTVFGEGRNRQFRKSAHTEIVKAGTAQAKDWAQVRGIRRLQLKEHMKKDADTDFTRAILNYEGIRSDEDYKKLAVALHALTPETGPGKFKGEEDAAGSSAEAENRSGFIYAHAVQEPLVYEASLHHANEDWGEAVKQLRSVSRIQGAIDGQSLMQYIDEKVYTMLSINRIQDAMNSQPGDLSRMAYKDASFGLECGYTSLNTELRSMAMDALRLGLLASAKPEDAARARR